MRAILARAAFAMLLPVLVPMLATAGEAKGTLTHKGATLALRHAYLVTGPDVFDRTKIVRRLVVTTRDEEAKLRACKDMTCIGEELDEGLTIDFDGGPRLKYWMVRNKQNVQHSDTASPSAFAARRDEPRHLAGEVAIDDAGHGGPRIVLDFDAPLIREFK